METGSISKWSLKVGDKFEAGTAICEVETDKATVTYEATEDGYIAKILVGSGDVKVMQRKILTALNTLFEAHILLFCRSASLS